MGTRSGTGPRQAVRAWASNEARPPVGPPRHDGHQVQHRQGQQPLHGAAAAAGSAGCGAVRRALSACRRGGPCHATLPSWQCTRTTCSRNTRCCCARAGAGPDAGGGGGGARGCGWEGGGWEAEGRNEEDGGGGAARPGGGQGGAQREHAARACVRAYVQPTCRHAGEPRGVKVWVYGLLVEPSSQLGLVRGVWDFKFGFPAPVLGARVEVVPAGSSPGAARKWP